MARMYPSQPEQGSPPSEGYVFEVLRGLPDQTTVLHSRRFFLPAVGREKCQEGEVDFLLVDPIGLVVLEVKGGEIKRERSGWTSTDRNRQVHKIDPAGQATRAAHAIHRYLTKQPWYQQHGPLRFGWGVVFPESDVQEDLGQDLPRALILDRRDLRKPAAALERLVTAHKFTTKRLSDNVCELVRDALAPCFHLVPSLAARLDRESLELVRLTEEQMSVLDYIEEHPRAAIRGAAGTGKTLLATEKARRLAATGKHVLLICFNLHLGEFLARQARGYDVYALENLCKRFSNLSGISFNPPPLPDGERYWVERAPTFLFEAVAATPAERYDAVIVDEAQDFREDWWPSIDSLLREPGKGVLYAFYDPNQNLFGGGPPRMLDVAPTSLRWNCRNTERIAAYAARFISAEVKVRTNAPEGVDVQEARCRDAEATLAHLRQTLRHLVEDEHLEPERIVVLTARSSETSALRGLTDLGGIPISRDAAKQKSGSVRFSSLRKFKGLEADAVILCEIDDGAQAPDPKLLYVGASRARLLLHVMRVGGGAS